MNYLEIALLIRIDGPRFLGAIAVFELPPPPDYRIVRNNGAPFNIKERFAHWLLGT